MNRITTLAVCITVSLLAVPALAGAPTHFRQNSGRIEDKHPLPDNFEQDARIVWRSELQPGLSTPCVYDNSVYLTTYEADKQELATVSLDRRTGELQWKQVCPASKIEPFHSVGSPAASTVACNGQQVFSFFGSYGLLCYDLSGKLLWKKPMGPFQDEFGASSSPVLVDNLVVLNEDHDLGSFLIGIDQATGSTVWQTNRPEATRSYATPVIWDAGDAKQILVAGALELAAYDARNGEKLWWVKGLSRIVDSTPVLSDGDVFLATWTPGGDSSERISMEPFPEALQSYDKNSDQRLEKHELPEGSPVIPRFFRIDLDQNQKLDAQEWARHASVFQQAKNMAMRVSLGGKGDVTQSNIRWTYRRGLPTVPSSVVYQGLLYMVKDSGIITSLDAETGKRTKTDRAPVGRGNYYASLFAGDGKVYVCSERGVVTVLKAGPRWQVLSSHDFSERIMATPAVADGKMFVRTDAALYCFEKS